LSTARSGSGNVAGERVEVGGAEGEGEEMGGG